MVCCSRDVKAENVVLEGGRAGGRVFLVDFGGVQVCPMAPLHWQHIPSILAAPQGLRMTSAVAGAQAASAADSALQGSTMIGTYGYMAPEQFGGTALPASDLYGLGGTLLYLLSGDSPQLLSCWVTALPSAHRLLDSKCMAPHSWCQVL